MRRPETRPNPIDLSLYLVTDRELCGARGLVATVAAALQGGITVLQYRAKQVPLREAIAEAALLASLARQCEVPFIVNDRLDLALAVDADGLHIGQSDMPADLARRFLGPRKILGLSVARQAEVDELDVTAVDYVGLGPVFATATKADAAAPLGLEQFSLLRASIELPVVAIGGISPSVAGDVIGAGADGIAVVSAICAAAEPKLVSHDLRQKIEQARKTR
ncbi:MAG TPA: thiamine phosphate synthase [Terriglobia bacterium]|nr:thiamine phosphate synthase [Terriglobia bacterium]